MQIAEVCMNRNLVLAFAHKQLQNADITPPLFKREEGKSNEAIHSDPDFDSHCRTHFRV